MFQRLFVKPNELELERPYLEQNIALTQAAYNLHQISAKPFPAEQTLTLASLQGQSGHHRQHPAVGWAAVDGRVPAAAGDPDLLQVP